MAQPPLYQFSVKQCVLTGDKETCVNQNLAKKVLDMLKSDPSFIGQINVQTGESITYQVMREKSVKCALFLKLHEIKAGDIITICPSETMDFYVPFLAGLYIGAIVNTWDVRCKLNFEVLLRIRPKVIFIDKRHVLEIYAMLGFLFRKDIQEVIIIAFQQQEEFLSLDTILSLFSEDDIDTFTCTSMRKIKETAVILHTFNVMTLETNIQIPHSAFLLSLNSRTPPMTAKSRGLWYLNLGSFHNLILLYKALVSGVTLLVWWQNNYKRLCRRIQRFQVAWAYFNSVQAQGLNDYLNNLVQVHRDMLSSENDGFLSCEKEHNGKEEGKEQKKSKREEKGRGEKEKGKKKEEREEGNKDKEASCQKEKKIKEGEIDVSCLKYLMHDFDLKRSLLHESLISLLRNTQVILLYSYPEIGIITCRLGIGKEGNIGFMAPNIELMIVDCNTGMKLGPKQNGEICCKSPFMMNGYYKMLMESAIDSQGWLRTKDLGYYDKGSVSVIGSISPTVRIQEKIFPTKAIEEFLETETVRKARILPLLHAKNTWRPCLFLLKNDTWVKKADVRKLMEARFMNFCEYNGTIIFLREMPYYLNNNVDMKSLYQFVTKYLQREDLRYTK